MASSKIKIFTLILKSIPKEVAKVDPFLKKVNRSIKFGETQFHNLLVATTEAVNNSIAYGNHKDSSKFVTITAKVFKSSIKIQVHDEGEGVKPEDIPNPLEDKNLLRENGRGIFLMTQFMDNVTFERCPQGSNVIMTLRKRKTDR
ncbi:MAG: ATP-binding protein [Bacteroidota bacterium]|nr:ATP-binding protein [Bacteroidota bacterium]